jgi:hypothetical protein
LPQSLVQKTFQALKQHDIYLDTTTFILILDTSTDQKLDRYNPEDVRLLLHPLNFIELQTLSSSLEAIIIAAAKPPYNARYPARD